AWILVDDALAPVRADLDLTGYPVGAGFRGFQNVLQGYHQVRAFTREDGPPLVGELVIREMLDAVPLRADGDRLVIDERAGAQEAARLAREGGLDSALIDA